MPKSEQAMHKVGLKRLEAANEALKAYRLYASKGAGFEDFAARKKAELEELLCVMRDSLETEEEMQLFIDRLRQGLMRRERADFEKFIKKDFFKAVARSLTKEGSKSRLILRYENDDRGFLMLDGFCGAFVDVDNLPADLIDVPREVSRSMIDGFLDTWWTGETFYPTDAIIPNSVKKDKRPNAPKPYKAGSFRRGWVHGSVPEEGERREGAKWIDEKLLKFLSSLTLLEARSIPGTFNPLIFGVQKGMLDEPLFLIAPIRVHAENPYEDCVEAANAKDAEERRAKMGAMNAEIHARLAEERRREELQQRNAELHKRNLDAIQ